MRLLLLSAVAAAALVPAAAGAVEPDFVGARIGTLGGGAEFGLKLNEHITARAIVNGFDIDYDDTSDDINYTGKFKLGSAGIQVDYRFMEDGPLYVTAGIYKNDNNIHATARPTSNAEVGGVTFTPEQIGTITANSDFKDTAPFLGIGARWPIGHFEFNLEAGAYFQGKPKVTMTSDGTYANNPTYQDALETERQDLQDDMDKFGTYPGVTLGLRYKF